MADGSITRDTAGPRYLVASHGALIIETRLQAVDWRAPRAVAHTTESAEVIFQVYARALIQRLLIGQTTDSTTLLDALQLSDAIHEARAWQREAATQSAPAGSR